MGRQAAYVQTLGYCRREDALDLAAGLLAALGEAQHVGRAQQHRDCHHQQVVCMHALSLSSVTSHEPLHLGSSHVAARQLRHKLVGLTFRLHVHSRDFRLHVHSR